MRAKIFVRFKGQCWYFSPQWTAGQATNKGELCLEQHYSFKELRSCCVSIYKSGYLEGFRRYKRSTLATQRNPDLHVSCSLPKQGGNSHRSEQTSYKLPHCDDFDVCTTGDTAHIDTIFKFLPHTYQHGCIDIFHCCSCLYHARIVLPVGGSFAYFARKACYAVTTDLLMWYSNTQNGFSPGAAILSLHTLT
jgi:hypothetical protein